MDVLEIVVRVVVGILIIIGLLLLYLLAWVRAARGSLDATIAAGQEVRHTDILIEDAPRQLRRLVEAITPELSKQGFKELLVGARLTLSEGRTDTYYHISVSPDKTATVELAHVRVGWHLGLIWPAQLPLSKWFGPVSLSLTVESFSTDHTTLITTTNPDMAAVDPLPTWRLVMLPPETPFEEIWARHRAEQRRIAEEERMSWILFDSREAHFNKERIQREQTTRKLQALCDEAFGEDQDTSAS